MEMGRHGPPEQTAAHGIDEPPENRPGVPMETIPARDESVHWDRLQRQEQRVTHLHRAGLHELTPVFGTAQPPRGVSGLMRRIAYRIPEHHARHWALLLAADRVDVMEDRLGRILGNRLDDAGFGGLAERIERNPVPALLIAVAAGAMLRRALR